MPKDQRSLARIQRMAVVVAAGVTAILGACSDAAAPTASAAEKEVARAVISAKRIAASLPEGVVAQGLLRNRPLLSTISVTKEISNNGGTIDVPEAGFELVVPAGAFAAPRMMITVRALEGATVAYDFEPRDAVFLTPLRFVQKTAHTNLGTATVPPGFAPQLSGAYFPNGSMIDPLTGVAVVTEILSPSQGFEYDGSQIAFDVWHFSGYMISTGYTAASSF